jgi:hypothetical protein
MPHPLCAAIDSNASLAGQTGQYDNVHGSHLFTMGNLGSCSRQVSRTQA